MSATPHPDLLACARLLRAGSRSFHTASLLLPGRVRLQATALYAFCRVADDVIDTSDDPGKALPGLHRRLDAIYAGRPEDHVADRAFARLVAEQQIVRELPDALLEGFAWDAQGRRYASIQDLHAYAARVAGSVGAMMAVVMEARDSVALARAAELGVAMQLTNIARDVGADAALGRIYLPLDWLQQAGIDPDRWLARPAFSPGLAGVVQRLLEESERLYARGECGIAALPRDCRPGIHAARLVYAEIGHTLARRGGDSVTQRSIVPRRRQLRLASQALLACLWSPGHPMTAGGAAEPLPAVRYLVEAASRPGQLPERTFYQRTVRVLDLFERLEQRQRGLV